MSLKNSRDNRRSTDAEVEELATGIVTSLYGFSEKELFITLDTLEDPDTMYANDLLARMVLHYQGETYAFSKFYVRQEIEATLYIITSLLMAAVEKDGPVSDLLKESDVNQEIHAVLITAILSSAQLFLQTKETQGIEKAMRFDTGESYIMYFLDEFTSMIAEVRGQED